MVAERPQRAGPVRRAGGDSSTARLGRESKPSSSLRTCPIGGSHLSARERKERRDRRRLGWEERN
jgi:hypothetical protein